MAGYLMQPNVTFAFPIFGGRGTTQNGIAWAVSTTPLVLSLDAAATLALSVQYS
jgi:hypothetical protein